MRSRSAAIASASLALVVLLEITAVRALPPKGNNAEDEADAAGDHGKDGAEAAAEAAATRAAAAFCAA